MFFLKGRRTWEVVIYNCSSVIAKSDLRALCDPASRLRQLSWNKLHVPAQVCSNRADWLTLCQPVSCQMCHQHAKRSRVLLDLARPVWGPFRQPLVLSSHPRSPPVAASTHHHPPRCRSQPSVFLSTLHIQHLVMDLPCPCHGPSHGPCLARCSHIASTVTTPLTFPHRVLPRPHSQPQ